jgi:hypothetical protein
VKNFKMVLVLALLAQLTVSVNATGSKQSDVARMHRAVTNALLADACVTQDEAETYTHQEGGVHFDAPKSWKAKADGDVLTLTTPDSSLAMVFWVAEEEGFDDALKAFDKEIAKTIKHIKPNGKGEEGALNGMPTYIDSGTGEVDGTTIEWSAILVKAKKPLIILSFAAPRVWEKHSDDYQAVLKSLKKI